MFEAYQSIAMLYESSALQATSASSKLFCIIEMHPVQNRNRKSPHITDQSEYTVTSYHPIIWCVQHNGGKSSVFLARHDISPHSAIPPRTTVWSGVLRWRLICCLTSVVAWSGSLHAARVAEPMIGCWAWRNVSLGWIVLLFSSYSDCCCLTSQGDDP